MFSRFVVSQIKHNSYFLVGVVLGLWLALVAVPLDETPAACPVSEAPVSDEFEPHREARPLGPAGPAAGRSIQRPRYYITELGMRGSLMSGVLSSEEALSTRTAALNATASRLQPLRVFIAAAAGAAPPRPNVVGFTDTREMLKPFHALKYLADNYLEEFDFFFLVSDTSFVNARRLRELVGKLSVSQDVYMGTVAEDDSHYCTLEGGILLSNSVLRAVHGELDWCVRNSYSAHHHENIGRCVLHAAHIRCHSTLQGETYRSVRVKAGSPPGAGLAGAVTAHPVTDPRQFYAMHALVSRLLLQRGKQEAALLASHVTRTTVKHPRGYRNVTWPPGIRHDVGLAPPTPENRFDHLRWTLFNTSHAFMPDDHRTVAPLAGPYKLAVQLVLSETRAWALHRWGGDAGEEEVRLVEGAWRWEPPYGLRYRLLLQMHSADGTQRGRMVEVSRALGPARLVPAPYVTESARVHLLVTIPLRDNPTSALRVLPALRALHNPPDNTLTTLIIVRDSSMNESTVSAVRAELSSILSKHSQPSILEVAAPQEEDEVRWRALVQRAVARAALGKLPRDALVLMLPAHADFNQDFLNRVRMNTISGSQWFWAVGFARYSQAAHPLFQQPSGASRPQHHTGRFAAALTHALSFYRTDLEAALSSWEGGPDGSIADVLASSPLRCLRGPDPALVLAPPPPPCASPTPGPLQLAPTCLRAHREDNFQHLQLGDKHALARLLLEERAATE